MIYFTADTHFGHAGIIKHCAKTRPFETIEEHDEALIRNWNSVVRSKSDTVYHIGDFGHPARIKDILPQLNGRKIFVRGNHDPNLVWLKKHIEKHCVVVSERLLHRMNDGQHIYFDHYAHRTWPRIGEGAWHLYGHSHGNIPDYWRSTDVGVDCWDLKPVSYDTLKAKFAFISLPDYGKKEMDKI